MARTEQRDVAGYVERIGPSRWRLVMPKPHFESQLDVMELVPLGQLISPRVHHFFVKFSDTPPHVGEIDSWAGEARVDALISFWSHALAAALFAALMLWRLGDAARQPGAAPARRRHSR